MFKKNSSINLKAEFRSKVLEDEYYEQQINSSKKYIQYIILAVGIAFFAISLYDYGFNDDINVFIRSTATRVVVLFFSVFSYYFIHKTSHIKLACLAITLFPLVLVLAYIYILAQQSAQGFMSQAMAVMAIVFCTTLLPNRWVNLVTVDIFIVVFFLLFSRTYIITASASDYTEVTIYLVLALIFSVVVVYRSNIVSREKFLWELELKKTSTTDKLTGTYNRLWFDRTFSGWFGGDENRKKFSLVLMDIDDFKAVNDTYGHLVGDQVLIDIAMVVKNSVRATDMLARWGGEEFVLLLPSAGSEKSGEIAEQIRRNVEEYDFGEAGHITISLGVAACTGDDNIDSLLKKADDMLYAAKHAGKNCVKRHVEFGDAAKK